MNEAMIDQAALGCIEALVFDIRKGADISPGVGAPLRGSQEHLLLKPRPRATLPMGDLESNRRSRRYSR